METLLKYNNATEDSVSDMPMNCFVLCNLLLFMVITIVATYA